MVERARRGDHVGRSDESSSRARPRRSSPEVEGERGDEFKDFVVTFGPVSKTVKGGRRRSFRALVVVGNGDGKVGAGLGKALDLTDAIRKGIEDAKKNLVDVPRHGGTIPHEVIGHFGAGMVLLRPASPGTGIIAGRGVRPLMELAGIKDVLAKSLGSSNPYNVVYAAMEALKALKSREEILRARGIAVAEKILPSGGSEVVTDGTA